MGSYILVELTSVKFHGNLELCDACRQMESQSNFGWYYARLQTHLKMFFELKYHKNKIKPLLGLSLELQ